MVEKAKSTEYEEWPNPPFLKEAEVRPLVYYDEVPHELTPELWRELEEKLHSRGHHPGQVWVGCWQDVSMWPIGSYIHRWGEDRETKTYGLG